jgi:hypothetical protein
MARGSRVRVWVVAVMALAVGLSSALPAHAVTSLKQSVDRTYQANGPVAAMVTVNNVTYLGGAFTSLRPAGTAPGSPAAVARHHLAAINSTTGQLLAWNPGTDGVVRAMAASPNGAIIYVGGDFGHVRGLVRQRVAAVNASTGAVTSFTASAGVSVYGLAASASKVYIAGSFSNVKGHSRLRLAAVSTRGVLDPDWTPSANAAVRAIRLAPNGSAVYVGGNFTAINGNHAQSRFAKLSPTTGAPLAWASHPAYPVEAITSTTGQVFIGGDGKGGNAASYTTTGSRQWRVQTDGGVQAIATMGGVVYIGGHFDNVCTGRVLAKVHPNAFTCPRGTVRHKLFAVDARSSRLDPWAPNPNSITGVWSLRAANSKLEVGGDFTLIGSPRISQQSFAQFSA